ncbi:MAG: hypothetical protein RSD36_17620 [Terrisporobacter sp.]
MESYLGGGPSPSAGWTYKYSGSSNFTAAKISKLSGEMQVLIN